jgi:RimJ/RimL family protein N-acetyltransferase
VSAPSTPTVLTSDSLVLRPFAEADLPDLLMAFADDEIALWSPGPTAEPEVVEWYRKRNDWTSGDHASWAAAERDGRLAGGVSLHHLDAGNRDGELGYWVAPWARRRGVGRAALSLAVDFGFTELDLHRICLYHAVENIASCRLALAAGFRQEGELRSSFRCGDGLYHDEHLHARLENE